MRRQGAGRVGAAALAAVVVPAVLLVAACSGDDGTAGPKDGDGEPTTTVTYRFSGSAASPFCAVLKDAALDTTLDAPSETPEEMEAAYTHLLDQLERADAAAPRELQADTALLVTGITELDEALRAVGYDYDALSASPQGPAVVAAVNDPQFGVAGDRIQAYKHQVCKL
jgi:hypothetical protein